MIDAPGVVLAYLRAQEAITTVFGNRIWAERVSPPEEADYRPTMGPAIAFRSRPGTPIAARRVLANSWQFKVYGVDEQAAQNAYRVLADVMHTARGMGILSADLELSGQTLPESVEGWVYVLAFFTIRMRSGLPETN